MEEEKVGRGRKSPKIPTLKIGNSVLAPNFHGLDDMFVEKAKNELRETPEVVEQALQDIKDLVREEPELYVPDDDEFYLKFLRPCKWYPKSAFELMKRFYKYQLNHARLCEELVPSKRKIAFVSDIFLPAPDRTDDGCRLLIINVGKKWSPKTVSPDELFKCTMMALEAAISEPNTQVAGVHVILDTDGFSLTHVTYLTPSFAGNVAEWVQKCLPCRLKGIHIVNQPFIFNMAFALFKPFLMEKTRKRIHFHGKDRASLIAYTGAKCLPTYLGGQLELTGDSIGEDIWRHFHFFEDDFMESTKYGYGKGKK